MSETFFLFSLLSALVLLFRDFANAEIPSSELICPIFLANYALQEEEFARNTFQSGQLRHDDRPLRPINPDGMAKRKKELGKRYVYKRDIKEGGLRYGRSGMERHGGEISEGRINIQPIRNMPWNAALFRRAEAPAWNSTCWAAFVRPRLPVSCNAERAVAQTFRWFRAGKPYYGMYKRKGRKIGRDCLGLFRANLEILALSGGKKGLFLP